MPDAIDRIGTDYLPAFLAFLMHRDEEHRHAAYELGRRALSQGISLLEMIRIHHSAFGRVLTGTAQPDQQRVVEDAAAFLVEAMAPFEMARRGFLEAASQTSSERPTEKTP